MLYDSDGCQTAAFYRRKQSIPSLQKRSSSHHQSVLPLQITPLSEDHRTSRLGPHSPGHQLHPPHDIRFPLSAFPCPESNGNGGGAKHLIKRGTLLPEGVSRGSVWSSAATWLCYVSPLFFAGDLILYKHVKVPDGTSAGLSFHRHSFEGLSVIVTCIGNLRQNDIMARIKSMEYFRVPPRWLFVKVTDEDGNVGWGEASLEGHTQAVEGCLDAWFEKFKGHDAEYVSSNLVYGLNGKDACLPNTLQ